MLTFTELAFPQLDFPVSESVWTDYLFFCTLLNFLGHLLPLLLHLVLPLLVIFA